MDIVFKNGLKIKNVGVKLATTIAFVAIVIVIHIIGVGCIFRYLFRLHCPGCGLTRAIASCLKLDFVSAFEYHQLFFTIPVLYLYFWFDGRIFGKIADRCILCGIFVLYFVRWIIILIK